jgi:hypothetical protein
MGFSVHLNVQLKFYNLPKKILPITKLEKQLGKKKFTELFSQEIVKPAGKPTLVPNSDRRQGIGKSNPKDEFKEEK